MKNKCPLQYTFDTFTVNPGNREAYECLKSLVDDKSPRLIWLMGPSGTGKTHLLYALKEARDLEGAGCPGKLISCQELMLEFIRLLKWDVYEEAVEDFVAMCCREELIFIEDIDYHLSGKNASQAELCNMIESMVKKHKKTVILTTHEFVEPFGQWVEKRFGEEWRLIKIESM